MPQPSIATKDSWPPNYIEVFAWRQQQLMRMRNNPVLLAGALEYYRTRPVEFICHWFDTYDPRVAGTETPARMPFILFERQAEMVQFLQALIEGQQPGLMEKCRDAGATWVCSAFSVWLWRFVAGSSIGWGSRKEALVDKIGDADSIFEKMRMLIRGMPREFWPRGFKENEHMPFMRILNPENESTITGEAGDNIGRGGRKLIYFKDESAHYERPEKIEAALADNTNVQVDISSVNGIGNVFYTRRMAGEVWKGGPAVRGKTNVFVMDWRDHPAKSQAWYDERRSRAENEGLLHIFAQEVDRDYAASVDGIIIENRWIKAAIDAHEKLGFGPDGSRIAGFDVADEGRDKHALAVRQGPMVQLVKDWSRGDVGNATRNVIGELDTMGTVSLQYDSIGVGAGVKSEANRLQELNQLPRGITFTPWNAGSGPQFPDKHVLTLPNGAEDKKSPTNQELYSGLKAQAWWELRLRFERTYKAVEEGQVFDPADLISLPSTLPGIWQIEKELGQATASRSGKTMKLVVDKKPDGAMSPNMADAIVMAFWPAIQTGPQSRVFL